MAKYYPKIKKINLAEDSKQNRKEKTTVKA